MRNKILSDILRLINSAEFQELNSYYNEKTLFSALNVERNENRHSSFIAWWLNPKSEHGLGDSPLKLFLRLVATKNLDPVTNRDLYNRMIAGDYRITLLEEVEVEKSVGAINNSKSKGRIDIWTVLELAYEEDGDEIRKVVPLVIENKIYSNEGNEQTKRYFTAASSYAQECVPMCIFLTVETKKPCCNEFKNVTYQELLTYVIEPLVSSVAPSSMQFVESFIRNLGRPALTENKYYGVLAVSQKECAMLNRVVEKIENKELFNTAFASLYNFTLVKKIVSSQYMSLDIDDDEKNLLRMLWDANEVVFMAVIYHLYGNVHKVALDKLFKSTNRDTSKYVVFCDNKSVFNGKRLSKAMTACAIFKSYLMKYPATTLVELQKAFPCKELNDYYYDRYYNDLFYEYQPQIVDEEGYTEWDFYLKDELLLPIENGEKKAMCVKMWRKGDFDKLCEFVSKNYEFIKVEKSL